MALAHQVPRTAPHVPTRPCERADALHELTAALAGAEDCLAREALAAAVQQLEALAGASLGDVDRDPAVLLQRRAARALRRLDRRGTAPDVVLWRTLAADLGDPCAALLRTAAGEG